MKIVDSTRMTAAKIAIREDGIPLEEYLKDHNRTMNCDLTILSLVPVEKIPTLHISPEIADRLHIFMKHKSLILGYAPTGFWVAFEMDNPEITYEGKTMLELLHAIPVIQSSRVS